LHLDDIDHVESTVLYTVYVAARKQQLSGRWRYVQVFMMASYPREQAKLLGRRVGRDEKETKFRRSRKINRASRNLSFLLLQPLPTRFLPRPAARKIEAHHN
jgi:hypothetical protein